MLKNIAEFYLPAVAMKPNDLAARDRILESTRDYFSATGFLLVQRGPNDLTPDSQSTQLDNLDSYLNRSRSERPYVKVMHPWGPLTGTKESGFLNFLNNPGYSIDYVGRSIDFAGKVPDELVPPSGRAVSFHLSAYLLPSEVKLDPDYWMRRLEDTAGYVKQVVGYGAEKGVGVHIETVPIPPFGDWVPSDKSELITGDHFPDLVTPWPGLPWRDDIERLRQSGARWTIDTGHMRMAIQGIVDVRRLVVQYPQREKEILARYMVMRSDFGYASWANNNFDELILRVTEENDMVHLSQAQGAFRTAVLHGVDEAYVDSAPFHLPGNISDQHLAKIVKGLSGRDVSLVLEVNETDFEESPNTKAAVTKIISIVGKA